MVKIAPSQIKTKEVLNWKGLHLLHAGLSSCSQKCRIFLNLKGLDWEGHYIDLSKDANSEPWFLGINPRGLVPVLVHDGEVHVESNDILRYAETLSDTPKLIPDHSPEVQALLDLEDDLHMDLRALTFRYVMPKRGDFLKDPEALARMAAQIKRDEASGNGADPELTRQYAWWKAANKDGITDKQVKMAAAHFSNIFSRLDSRLEGQSYIFGDALSAVDIAWFIYANRLRLAGYPLSHHKALERWFNELRAMDAFAKEIVLPPPFKQAMIAHQQALAARGDTFVNISGLAA